MASTPSRALIERLRRRAMTSRSRALRAFWTRALNRQRTRYLSATVTFDGVPTMRGLALLLSHARKRGWQGRLNSSDRRKGVAEKYGHQSQAALYDDWMHRRPGYLPANPPGYSSHELRSDGTAVFRVARGRALPWFQLGLDVNDDQGLARVLRGAGVNVQHPYSSGSEAHHLNVITDPTRVLIGWGDV